MPVLAATSGYNGGLGSVGGNAYAASSYDPYAQSQHAYSAAAMQPPAPSSPYRQQAAAGFGGGFGSTMAASNPYASSAAPVPGRSPVGEHGLCSAECVCVCVCKFALIVDAVSNVIMQLVALAWPMALHVDFNPAGVCFSTLFWPL